MTDASDRELPNHGAPAPDQKDVRPSERQIGVGVRTDGPNGQSSTRQVSVDSTIELLDAGEREFALERDDGDER